MFHDRRLRGADLLGDARAGPWLGRALDRRARSGRRTGSRSPRPGRPSCGRLRSSTPTPPRSWATSHDDGDRRARSRPPTRRARTTATSAGKPSHRDAEACHGDRRSGGDRRRGDARGRHRDRARPRARRDRGDHELHQHLEPLGHDRRRSAREEGRRAGPRQQALGEDLARARARPSSPTIWSRRASTSTSTSSASTSSATAARPASGTPGRCRRRSPRRSTRTTSWSARCSRATATSRAGSSRTCATTTSPRRPLCVAYALAGRMDIDLLDDPLGEGSDGEPVYLRDLWPSSEEIKDDGRRGGSLGHVHQELRGRLHRRRALARPRHPRRAIATRGPTRPTCAGPRFFEGMDAEPRPVEPIDERPGRWRCSATRSPPTTSRRPARSRRTARRASG